MPPNLDLNRHRFSPLANVCPPTLLDALQGAAGILDTEGKWFSISHSWDEIVGRTNRPDWRRDALLGKSFFELFPDDEQRQMFRKLLASMGEGKLDQHAQVVEYGSGAKALHLHIHIKPLWEEGGLNGYFVQCTDVSREYMNRIALLDRDRRMRELQTLIEEQKLRLETVISRGRERDDKLQALQAELERHSTSETESLAHKTLEHAQEISNLQQEIGRLTTEHAQEVNGLREEIARATAEQTQKSDGVQEEIVRLTEAHAQQVNGLQAEIARLIAEHTQQINELKEEYAPPVVIEHSQPAPAPVASNGDVLRHLTADLAEEYGNLLTGVLGHSTLAAAELGDSHTATEDLRAIERAARTAAKLTRKLSALSGAGRHRGTVELKACVQSYIKRNHLENGIVMPEQACEVPVDAAALEVILDAISSAAPGGLWSIEADGQNARLIHLTEASVPQAARDELLLAQEVARTYGGDVLVDGEQVVLAMPMAKEALPVME